MRIPKVILIVLALCAVSALSIGCGQESDSAAEMAEQVVAVQRGDITVDITAVGNLAFSQQEELAFGVEGTVGEVLVEVGDSVEDGQVLAQLDDTSIISLQKAVSQARVNLGDAEEALEEAEDPYTELDVAQAEAAVADAKVALEAAEEALEDAENPYTESDIAQAELAVINAEIALDKAEDDYERAEEKFKLNPSVQEREWAYEQKKLEMDIAEFNLAEAEDDLAEMRAGTDPLEVEQKQKNLAVAQADLKEAEDNLAEMLGSVDSLEIELKQSEIATAQAALDEAIERLEMATTAAPFAGIVTSVDVDSGDTVSANQVIIELVDPDRFETEILVSETDILNIQWGAEASIQVDSLPGISLPAEVTFISPTATIQQGVVNYTVEVEIQSLQAMTQERQEAKQKDGRTFPQEGESPPTMTTEDFRLREGLTVTVSIIVQESNDVLLVPNSAITSSGKQTYVRVVSPDGVIEDRLVTTGISNWQYTEIVEGLDEGDSVVVPETTATTSTTQQNQPNGRFIPGMGGFGK